MPLQDPARPGQQGGPAGIGQVCIPQPGHIFVGMVMGRGGAHVGIRSLDDQDVPVADTRFKVEDVGGATVLQGRDQGMGLLAADMVRGKIHHPDVIRLGKIEGHQIAAESGLVVLQGYAHGGGLQRRPARIV